MHIHDFIPLQDMCELAYCSISYWEIWNIKAKGQILAQIWFNYTLVVPLEEC